MPRQCAWWQRQAHFPEDAEEDKHMEDDVEEAYTPYLENIPTCEQINFNEEVRPCQCFYWSWS